MNSTTSLANVLYPAPDRRRTVGSLFGWWESRRPLYNAVVGATGLVTLSGLLALAALPGGMSGPGSLLDLVVPVMVYGLAANICYTAGWGLEVLARLVWKERAPRIGPFLFREGLFFSIGLTLLPLGLGVIATVGHLVSSLLR